ncbi:MAG: SDR family oxidoreductase [Rhodobiaceae bacterium]|nr:SDR family oxidoreductase [Rhodobiaceae bacterium]MCC0013377.1 SDR family oxidoreductase [Rhodobiaceae bacterium]MCC0018991.1 SDR family oxidoreductase [Rhodobiaceae bacterium]MCC0061509.1 SDR family oxidoreductase [Rhodobiaceae bacterium]
MSGVLDGKTALLTGASAGIGLATARAMLNAGTSGVVINGRNAERADAAAQSLKADFPDRTITAAPADIATPDGATKAVETALAALGHIDILVNSAGGNDMPALFHKLDIATIPGMVGPACNAIVLPCRAVLDHMSARGSGSIINVASDAAKIATPGESVIGGVMAFIAMFTRGLAIEAKRNGIRANCITPSIVRGTPLYDRLMEDPFAGKLFAKAEAMAHLGVVEAEELADLAVFLASPAAARITGQAISINGGISAA